MKQKQVFSTIFLLFTLFLVLLPFLVTFNEFLTRIVENFKLYKLLQDQLVPVEVKMVKLLVSPLGVNFVAYQNGMVVKGTFLQMTWNCIGWQSLFLLVITLWVGLRSGIYTFSSRVETVCIGLLGTFLINIFRLSVIVLIFAYLRPLYAYIYHDYLAAIVTIVWLFFFWWFSYSFVLEEKTERNIAKSL